MILREARGRVAVAGHFEVGGVRAGELDAGDGEGQSGGAGDRDVLDRGGGIDRC